MNRTQKIYTLFLDYLLSERMGVEDVVSIQESLVLREDYEGAEGIGLALLDYVGSLSLNDFN